MKRQDEKAVAPEGAPQFQFKAQPKSADKNNERYSSFSGDPEEDHIARKKTKRQKKKEIYFTMLNNKNNT